MDLDDIFDQGHKRRNQNYDHDYRHDDDYRRENEYKSHSSHTKQNDLKLEFLNKLQSNPKLKMMLLSIAGILVLIAIGVIILLFPVILKLFGFVSENGIEGFLNTIWKGTK